MPGGAMVPMAGAVAVPAKPKLPPLPKKKKYEHEAKMKNLFWKGLAKKKVQKGIWKDITEIESQVQEKQEQQIQDLIYESFQKIDKRKKKTAKGGGGGGKSSGKKAAK